MNQSSITSCKMAYYKAFSCFNL